MSPLAHSPLAQSPAGGTAATAVRAGGFAGLLWLTWRQHRWALIGSAVLAAVITGWLAYLAADMTSYFHQCHNRPCAPGTTQDAALSARSGPFRVADDILQLVQYLPLLIGMFLGVPLLAREHEQRTLLLAWSQDVSPARWLWTKLGLLGGVVAVLTTAISLASDHASHVMGDVSGGGLFDGDLFFDSAMLPLALGLAWFAVGAALGAATRRLLPAAMAAVAGFVGLFFLVQWRYPYIMTPVSRFRALGDGTQAPGPIGGDANALKIKGGFSIGPQRVDNVYDSAGHRLGFGGLQRFCPTPDPARFDPGKLMSCMARNHFKTLDTYQPADRIGHFHLVLASGYAGIGALALAAVWLIVRRTSLSAG